MRSAPVLLALLVSCGARSDLLDDGPLEDASVADTGDAGANDASPTFVQSFDLTITPSLVTLVQGGLAVSVDVHVTRINGFAGQVEVSITSLPTGVTATTATVAPNMTDVSLMLTAIAPGPQAAQSASVYGTASMSAPVTKPLSLFVRGCPGCLDTTFNSNGFAFVDSVYGHTIAIDGNGSIIVPGSNWEPQGSFAKGVVARVLANGAVDTTFGAGGQLEVAFGQNVELRQLSVSSTGEVVVCGSMGDTSPNVLVAKVTPTGTLDTTFANGGVLSISGGHCGGVQFQSGDTILMLNDIGAPNLVRLLPNGSVDSSYGTVTFSWSTFGFLTDANIVLDSSGGALVPGGTDGHYGAVTSRVVSAAVDQTFGTAGALDDTSITCCASWVDTNATNLLAVGPGSLGAVVAKYKSDGTRDTSFGSGGIVSYNLPASLGTSGTSGLFQADGAILALGYVLVKQPSQHRLTYLRRFTGTGALDATFANGGILFDDVTMTDNVPGGMAIYPDDRVVVHFNALNWSAETWATVLARIWL